MGTSQEPTGEPSVEPDKDPRWAPTPKPIPEPSRLKLKWVSSHQDNDITINVSTLLTRTQPNIEVDKLEAYETQSTIRSIIRSNITPQG